MSRWTTWFIAAWTLLFARASYGQSIPNGAHPRIWLDTATLATMREQATDAATGAAKAIALCADARANPTHYDAGGTWTFDWGFVTSACGIAYQVAGSADDAATGIQYLNALLDDYQKIGDGGGGDGVVQHDTGYAIRSFAPYAALGYDWLHDAPGMTDALRAHARERFKAWTDWYAASGYLKDLPGANYQAGYTFAATLIAIAEGSEAGTDGDALFHHVVDQLFAVDLARGFTDTPGAPADDTPPGGVLRGGDWAEGWQYGPLSVMEYVLSARALEEQGIPQPDIDAFAGDLVVRSLYATNPQGTGLWVGGDFDSEDHWQAISPRTLAATLAGRSTDTRSSWARAELTRVGMVDDQVFQSLADARKASPATMPTSSPTTLYIPGTRTLFTRDKWGADGIWAVFSASPHLVEDHEHFDAGNWALTRGADDLIVDPSPYGGRSTLTSNAPAVDSNLLGADYTPSQTPWASTTTMTWHRATADGVVVARADYHDSFRFRDQDSDVPVALRDFVFIPTHGDATVLVLDRVKTGDAARGLHVRIRTPATLTTTDQVTKGTVGASQVLVRTVFANGNPTAAVRSVVAGSCDSAPHHGSCDAARFAVNERKLDLAGPASYALDVVDATAAGSAAPDATPFSGPGYRGVAVTRGSKSFTLVASDAPDAAPGSALSYDAPGAAGEHIVVDAPAGNQGRSNVVGTPSGAGCHIEVTPHDGESGGFASAPLLFAVSSACAITDVSTAPEGIDNGSDAGKGSGSGEAGASVDGSTVDGATHDAGGGAVAHGEAGGAGVTQVDAGSLDDAGVAASPDSGSKPSDTGCGCRLAAPSSRSASQGSAAACLAFLGLLRGVRRRSRERRALS